MLDIIKYSRLNKQGYIIPKIYLSEKLLDSIENDLTVEPEIDRRFKDSKCYVIMNLLIYMFKL